MDVDIVVLTRDAQSISEPVLSAIRAQQRVGVHLHRVIGAHRSGDEHRWATIARARNVGKALGATPWLMFVDDDVQLSRDCVDRLLGELRDRPELAAIGADYLSERRQPGIARHVAMGATLFRREVLAKFEFRWQRDRCECQCMADDLRSQSFQIDYSASASAIHLTSKTSRTKAGHSSCGVARQGQNDTRPGPTETGSEAGRPRNSIEAEILVAFDRAHVGLFVNRFLQSLRRSGNWNKVHAVVYGLRERDTRSLSRLDGVSVHPQPYSPHRVCRSRLLGFQYVLRSLCPESPVAYWDAGDVIFQTGLDPLWHLVHQQAEELLVVEEPLELKKNTGQLAWIRSIADRSERRRAIALTKDRPVVNGGFMAGHAGHLLSYLENAQASILGRLAGAGGGDQVVLNVHRLDHPSLFAVIDDTWNYCLVGRSGRDCKVRGGRYWDLVGRRLVSVVHGNAGTLQV